FTHHRALRKPSLIRDRGAAVLVAEYVQRAGYFFQCLGAGLGVDEGQALDPWRTVACRAAIVATDASVLCGGAAKDVLANNVVHLTLLGRGDVARCDGCDQGGSKAENQFG